MSRIAYVDGRYVPHAHASVHIEDRGFQFADGIYEVIAVISGRRFDEPRHMDRLERSLGELDMAMPMSRAALCLVMDEVVRRNRVDDGILYLQVTRGAAPRDHAWRDEATPRVVMTARRQKLPSPETVAVGVGVITAPDLRWRRNDIKSVALLANVLGKQKAKHAGAYETWLFDDAGHVTECTSANAWIVVDGRIVTRPLGNEILGGITRAAILDVARTLQIPVDERLFTVADAAAADEAFLTSTTAYVMPVTAIDDRAVGDGAPGPVTTRLREEYLRVIGEFTGT
jgi:D-alanine transaminase